MVIETRKPEETYELGRKMGREAEPGQIICLSGDLGVGKTVFTQGFAAVSYTHLDVYKRQHLPQAHPRSVQSRRYTPTTHAHAVPAKSTNSATEELNNRRITRAGVISSEHRPL